MKKILSSLLACSGIVTGVFAQVPVTDFSGSPTTICAGQSVTWSNLTTGATTYTWSFPGASGGTTSNLQNPNPKTYNTPGTYTVTLIGTNANGNDTMKKADYITVLATPAITVTPGSGTICASASITLSASGGNSYSWAPSLGLDNITGSTVIATPSASTTYTVSGTGLNGCAANKIAVVTIRNIPTTPGNITGSTTVCSGQTGVVYIVPNPGNPAPTYTWTIPAGATITSGQGTRSVTITFGTASGTICCTAGNACGTSASSCQSITVVPNSAVGTVGTITGPTTICGNQSATYSIASVSGASTYSWTIPAGAVITAGQGTETISVTYSVTGGNVCVSASNNCSTSPSKCMVVAVTNIPPSPAGITGPSTVCIGQTDVVYTVPNTGNPAPIRTWTVPSGATITSGQGTRSVTITFGTSSGTVCCTPSNTCGTGAAACKAIAVSPSPQVGAVGSITGPTSLCGAQMGVTYSIGMVLYASTYTWTTTGTATVTAGQGTATVTVAFGTGNSNVCVSAGNDCSTSAQVCKTVSVVSGPPAAPGGITGLSTVCSGQSGVAYSVAPVANTSYYLWTIPTGASLTAGQGTRSVTIIYGTSSGSVCASDSNVCGKSAATCKAITVNPNPQVGTVGTITGPTALCGAQTGVTYFIGTVANASTYTWTASGTATITAGQGTTIVTIAMGAGNHNICVSAANDCSASAQVCKTVSIVAGTPAGPAAITGQSTVCNGQAGAGYSIANVANTSYYLWTIPTGASLTAGQGTRSVTITYGASSGSVCVSDSNACGKSGATCKAITVDPNSAVGTVSAITGPTAVCASQSGIMYSIPPVTGASSYTWTVPAGAGITSGQGTASITITYSVTAGNVCVTAGNSCSTTQQKCLTVALSSSVVATPGAITGATTVCNGQVGPYSVSPVAGALSYAWTVPSGATITSGQGTVNSVITFGAFSGTVCVSAVNGCGTSAQSCSPVVVDAAVLTVSTTITNTTTSALCDGSSTAIPVGGSGPYTYAWAPSGVTTASATGLCFGSHTVCVTNAGGCMTCKTVFISSPTGIATLTDNGSIIVYPNPANGYIVIEGTLSSSANLHVNVINMFGQKVIDESVFADKTFSQKINIQGIPSGVYFIEIRSGEMVRNSKIIKIQ